MSKDYYVIQIIGDVEPVIHGPYFIEEDRDKKAKELRKNDGDFEDGIYPLNISKGSSIYIDSYSGSFFEENKGVF